LISSHLKESISSLPHLQESISFLHDIRFVPLTSCIVVVDVESNRVLLGRLLKRRGVTQLS
jgi:hypothetical protein